MNTPVINLLTDCPYNGTNKGISTFQIHNNSLIIRGTFSKEDLKEILEIMEGKKEKHSKVCRTVKKKQRRLLDSLDKDQNYCSEYPVISSFQ